MEATYTLTTPSHPGLIIRAKEDGLYIEFSRLPVNDVGVVQSVVRAIENGTVAQLTLPDGYRLVKHLAVYSQ